MYMHVLRLSRSTMFNAQYPIFECGRNENELITMKEFYCLNAHYTNFECGRN
jgi:hypothetical protein